jgi:hypothetical protein
MFNSHEKTLIIQIISKIQPTVVVLDQVNDIRHYWLMKNGRFSSSAPIYRAAISTCAEQLCPIVSLLLCMATTEQDPYTLHEKL